MTFRTLTIVLAAAGLTGCGSFAHNSDVPSGIYVGLGDRPPIAEDTRVRVVDSGPALSQGGYPVSGESCRNKIWEASPSRDNAIALMKRQAAERGFFAIHSVTVQDDGAALLKNCWSGIIANGVAFKGYTNIASNASTVSVGRAASRSSGPFSSAFRRARSIA